MRRQEPGDSEEIGEPDGRGTPDRAPPGLLPFPDDVRRRRSPTVGASPGAGRAGGAALGLAALLVGVVACSGAHPPKSMAPEGKYRWALEHYEARDYGAAAKAFKDFLLEAPLSPRADSGQYLLGESYYRDGDYRQAADAFDRLGTNRPTSDLADDALLGVCRSYWHLSPELALDQDYTHKAESACSRLLQYYPDSPLTDSAKALQDSADFKLAAKAYRVGKWYYDQKVYESANVYFELVLKNYPEAPIVPDVLSSLYHSYRKIGFDSEAQDIRKRLLSQYADSQAARKLRDETGQGD